MADVAVFKSEVKPDWCPGCGDFGVLNSLQKACADLNLTPSDVMVVSGIGCSSNLPGFFNSYGMHSLHGRSLPVAQGAKFGNHGMTVIATGGDGDGYGIGVGRSAAAAIEQNHDAKGIIWPAPIAPFHVHLLPLGDKSGKVLATAQSLESELEKAGIEVLVDDRDERPGVKFNDADLIGCPYQVVIGEKNLVQNLVELKERRTGIVTKLAPADVAARLKELLGPVLI